MTSLAGDNLILRFLPDWRALRRAIFSLCKTGVSVFPRFALVHSGSFCPRASFKHAKG